ncbi:MAG: penicillin-binding protein activator [Pseudomonadota bacterium]
MSSGIMRAELRVGLIVALIGLWGSCAKPPTVVRNGVVMPVEQAAKMDYAEAERFFAQKQYKNAGAIYQRMISQLGMTTLAPDAMFRMAQIHRIRKNPKDAAKLLEAILSKYPKSDVYGGAKEELGLLLYAEKDYRRSAEILASMDWKGFSESKRPKLEKVARSAFDQANVPSVKFRWLVQLSDLTPEGPALFERKREIVALLDEGVDPETLKAVADEREGRFPADYICFKLAKIAYHLGDLDSARKLVTSFLNRYPNHEFSREAVELSERLYRSEKVDPKAIGLLVPMSGTNEAYAQQVLQGAALALNLFTAPSPAEPVRLYIGDSGDTPEQAVGALEKLVREHNIIAAAGPLFARQSQAASITAADMGLPIISLSAAEGITQIGPTVFRNGLTKSEQAANLAYIAKDVLGIQRCAILYPANNYGTEFMRLFWREFAARGGEIRGAEGYDAASRDFSTALKRIVGLAPLSLRQKELCTKTELKEPTGRVCYAPDKIPPVVDFECLFLPDNYDMADQIAPMLPYYDVRGVQLLGTNLWDTAELLQSGNSDYLQGAIFLDGFTKDRKSAPVPQFVERFYSTFGREPGIFEAFTYDTLAIMISVIDRGNPPSREAFAAGLAQVKDFPGVTGATSFRQNRDAARRLAILTVDGSRIVELE